MRVDDNLWTHWNKAPTRLWQTQLNFAVWCASSACGVSSEHLNYTEHPMIRAVYRFHTYYHVKRVLKRLQVPLPHESSFNTSDNPACEQGRGGERKGKGGEKERGACRNTSIFRLQSFIIY